MAWHRYTLVVIGLTASLCIQNGNSDDNNTVIVIVNGQTTAQEDVCETPRCLSTARGMIQKMKLSANPCEDFNEFACGRFIEETKIPAGADEVWPLTIISDQIKEILRDIILEADKPTDPQYLINIKRFYKSCMDEDTIEAVGLTPYLTDLEFVDDWPTLNPSWSGANFDLNEVIVRYSKVFINSILDWILENDFADSNRLAIYLSHGSSQLYQTVYSKPRNDTVLQAYENYLVEFAVALNASREVAEQDAKDVVDLEIELTKIKTPLAQIDYKKLYNPVQLNQLSTMYPELDIAGYLRTAFGLVNITLADNETIINTFPTYYRNVSQVVKQFSNRTLQNLFGFHYAISKVEGLTRRMRQIKFEFDKVNFGTESEAPRSTACMDSTSKVFSDGFGKQFVSRHSPEAIKHDINDMIDNLMPVFRDVIQETPWMGNATKAAALVKLAAMKRKIGYPDVGFEEADIEEQYRHYIMKVDDYYGNRVLGHREKNLRYTAAYGKPVNKNKWAMSPHATNAYYNSALNEIVFLTGIMQPPFYSETFQDYVNYGAIGVVIGHEILHGFDKMGSTFDENGNLRDWWSPEDKKNFDSKTQCVIDQNSNTFVEEINMTLNGNSSVGESMADSGGIKIAFRAYKNLVNKSGQQPRLPGLDLSQDQLFFLSFAQTQCAKYTPKTLELYATTFPHPPGKYRILLTMKNTEEFAKAYHCPVGSVMNPADKCNVWQPSDLNQPTPSGSQGNRLISYSLGLIFLHLTMLTCYMNVMDGLTF